MVKPINFTMTADKKRRDVSLQVVRSEHNFRHKVGFTEKCCIFNNLEITWRANFNESNNFYLQYFSFEEDYKIYKINNLMVALNKNQYCYV
ncbi:MAG: hypothetical protein KME32_02540 [Mojavia pulchra JT2-VF2]|jgi:hypothetical protein|uniref:Uncharacterized protein n=1 Tax=Mojavia pulchra JT2-VF2 TaxID=287848 RepID=A0A951UE48_9NOST|nr:hypothetical protein [Mojavia pulchra JT2-VF2]